MMSKSQIVVSWVLQLAVAAILFQTLFFKFTGAPESVYIFSTLGAEPWGRIGSGIVELVVVALIVYPPTIVYGAVLGLGVASGAILSHTKLGLVVQGDGGLLFALAVTVLMASAGVVFLRRADLPYLGERLFRSVA
jgi:putative oxidoreductase